jgi:hypothetical protein
VQLPSHADVVLHEQPPPQSSSHVQPASQALVMSHAQPTPG